MKKKFLGIIAVFLLSVFIIPSKVFAADTKVFTINIPSKSSSYYDFAKNMTMREYTLGEYINIYEILDDEQLDDVSYEYKYKDGKSAESYIDITDELRQRFIDELGEDILKDYDKISLKLYEPQANSNDGKLVIDFTEVRNKDYWDLSVPTCELPNLLIYLIKNRNSDIINNNFKIAFSLVNKNGKVLASESMAISDEQPKIELNKNLTEADDIIYTITDEDIEKLGLKNFSYKTFVMKFSDKSYDDETAYVYDVKAIIEQNNNRDSKSNADFEILDKERYIIINYFMDVMYSNKLLNQKATIQNANGKDLLYFDMLGDMFGSGVNNKFELAADVTSKDNIVLNITDEDALSAILKMETELDITKLFINFPEYKIYKVLEGAKQKFDISSKKQLIFRIDVDYNVFEESGKVYMDGKLVDSKNYTTKSGSTIITFNTNYTNTLSEGTHTLKVTTNQGETTTTFTITDSVNNPNTGDNILIYIGLLTISVGSIIASVVLKKKVN